MLSLLLLPLTAGAAEGTSFQLQRLDVSTALERADLIRLDARPRSHWQQGHLPNALSFSWEDYSRTDP
ncbi:MAG: rhodanese-like domain-containing protein, partial [Desulfuromonas thiophila]|nr:rhodanese-like domain-containing protein [Desulfuromonas thiophila]